MKIYQTITDFFRSKKDEMKLWFIGLTQNWCEVNVSYVQQYNHVNHILNF